MVMPQLHMPIPGHPHYAAWASYAQAQAQMAIYPYGQQPKMIASASRLGPRTLSAPSPATSSSRSNSSRKSSVEPSSSRTTKIDRSGCKGPPAPFDPNERYGRAFTNQPLVRSHTQTPNHLYYYHPSQKAETQTSTPSMALEAVGQVQLTSLLKRLASRRKGSSGSGERGGESIRQARRLAQILCSRDSIRSQPFTAELSAECH